MEAVRPDPHGLRSCKSAEARAIETDIRARLSVVETSPDCFFYVAAAFAKAYVENIFGKKRRKLSPLRSVGIW